MKKLTLFLFSVAGFTFFSAFIINTGADQANRDNKSLPLNVLEVTKKSCVYCHTEPGKKLALAHVNLSKWESYTAEKQASKSRDMCNKITKGKMPPKSFRAKNPDFVMSKEDIKTICDWSASIQVANK
jgi:hypothetical protein